MFVSAHDVARELRDRIPSAGTVKVHKLLYYAQGWHLAWTGELLFAEDVVAWENGPVIEDVWYDEDRGIAPPTEQSLDHDQLLAVEYTVSRYGGLSARELIDLTHSEQPWATAWAGGAGRNATMTTAALRGFFQEAMAAEDEVDPDAARKLAAAYPPLPAGPVVDDTETLRKILATTAS